MKNLVLLISILLSVHVVFGQLTPTTKYRIANNTTSLGINISSGTQVFDMANKKLYVALRAVPSTITIEAGLADVSPYFEVVGGSSLSMKPTASSVGISGTIYVGSTVNGTYIYESDEAAGAPEGTSTFKWYQADDNTGTNKAAISGATTTSYLIGSLAGKWLAFGVTPVSTIPATGSEVLSSPWQYIYVGGVTASVSLTGNSVLYKGQVLAPTPTFTPPTLGSCDQTANSTYTWYRNSSASKTGATTIASGTGTSPTYTVLNTDENQYIGLEVIPDASCNAATTPGIDWKQAIALTPVYADVTISGLTTAKAKTGTTLTAVKGSYTSTPTNIAASEGTPTYQWYWATDASGTGKTTIAGQTASTHAADKTLYGYTDGNYLAVGITPKTVGAETGTEVLSTWVEVYTNTAPVASAVTQVLASGSIYNVGATLNGSYTYYDVDGDTNASTFKWYRASSSTGTSATVISTATSSSYTLTSADIGYYIGFEVTPASSVGTSPGTTIRTSTFSGPTLNVAPDGVTAVVEITSSYTGRVWMDRNLGAPGVASSVNDVANMGHLYQGGRGADGHQVPTSSTTGGPISTVTPGHGLFIACGAGSCWTVNDLANNCWQPVTQTNNPCPTGFRVPTKEELYAEVGTINVAGNTTVAYSNIKLVVPNNGRQYNGTYPYSYTGYWTSSQVVGLARRFSSMIFYNNMWQTTSDDRAFGLCVRCIKDE